MPVTFEPTDDRKQTDDSLRVEREKADEALDEEGTSVDETADAVITRARARADDVLATARAKTDQQTTVPTTPKRVIWRERAVEDQVLQEERANADETLREERAEHVALLSHEREATDQDLANERARSDESLAIRDKFLAVVSHDLRNMLNAIVGSARLIAAGAPQEIHQEQILLQARRIERSGARMNRLIGDLVDVASIQAGMLTTVREVGDPTQIVMEAVETFQAQASTNAVSLVAEIASPLSLAIFDPARILQVLGNLVGNAIKFTPAHGKVVVRVENVGDHLKFAVSDTGDGIPPAQLETVFERFHQVTKRDRRGAGLGLYISRAIVQGHGGRIWAESAGVGSGSTFSFTLPTHVA